MHSEFIVERALEGVLCCRRGLVVVVTVHVGECWPLRPSLLCLAIQRRELSNATLQPGEESTIAVMSKDWRARGRERLGGEWCRVGGLQ